MGLRERLASRMNRRMERWSLARMVPTWLAGRPLPTAHDFGAFAQEGYRKSLVVYGCVRELSSSAAEPDLCVMQPSEDGEGEPVKATHPLMQLLARPNPEQSQYEWLEEHFTHLWVAGNAYVLKERYESGRVRALWNLRPDRVRLVPSADGEVERYEYSVGEAEPQVLKPADVIHSKLPDAADDYYGLSPIAVAARAVDLDASAFDYLRAFFLNSGTPPGLLKFKSVSINKLERERVKELWQEQHSGLQGWHSIGVLDADVDYQSIGSTLDRLRLDAVFDETETRICAAFGVPPILAGTRIGLLRGTYANYQEARRQLWEETLCPAYVRDGDKLTVGLALEFGPDLWIAYDLRSVAALQESIDSKRKWAREGFLSGLLSRDEARSVVGLEAIDDDEEPVYWSATNGKLVRSDGEPLVEPVLPPALAPGAPRPGAPVPPQLNRGRTPRLRLAPGCAEEEDAPDAPGRSRPAAPGGSGASPGAAAPEPGAGAAGAGERASSEQAGGAGGAERHAGKGEPEYRLLHRIADENAEDLARAFLANRGLRIRAVEVEAVARAIRLGQFAEAERLATGQDFAERFEEDLHAGISRTATEAGVAVAARMAPNVRPLLDVGNPFAARWAREHAANLVREINDETRDAIRSVIRRAFERGWPPEVAARRIRGLIGLTIRQAEALLRAFEDRQAEGWSDERLRAWMGRETRKRINRRARTIARTETIQAASRGQLGIWQDAAAAGLLEPSRTEREWIVTPDDRLCETICLPMAGQRVRLDRPFVTPEGSEIMTPPAHVLCRCAVGIATKD